MIMRKEPQGDLGNDDAFINKEYSFNWYEAFWGSPKQDHETYTQSGQYHIIVESRVRLTWYQSHALNLVVPINW